MLNISTIKNNSLIKRYALKKLNSDNRGNLSLNAKNSSLAPLAKDTVSFTGGVRFQTAIGNHDICEELHNNAKAAQNHLANILNDSFSDLVYSSGKNVAVNRDGVIECIESRIKSADSIEEKIASKIEDALHSNSGKKLKDSIFSPYVKSDIKKNINDICGARIIMRNADGDNPDIIIKRLCETIRKNDIIVDKIENYTPEKDSDIRKYFKQESLDELAKAVNEVRNKHGYSQEIEVISTEKKSGYMALHLDINLGQIGASKEEKGFHSELQVIGADVALLKDIEDLCYKLKSDKKIKSGNAAYTPFEQFFLNAYKNPDSTPDEQKVIENIFNEYTKKAYLLQRNKTDIINDGNSISKKGYKYPTIKECGFEKILPPILDFNNLARIKQDCDDLYYIETHPQECINGITESES